LGPSERSRETVEDPLPSIMNLERDGVPSIQVALAMVAQKTEEVYRRYAIV
jgi:hypothetical protein